MHWINNCYYVPEHIHDVACNFEKYTSAKTKDGKIVYIYKSELGFLSPAVQEAFRNLKKYNLNDFQAITLSPCKAMEWSKICKGIREENIKRLLPVDILNSIARYLDESTKMTYALSCHVLKRNLGKLCFKDICTYAAKNGNSEILKWARLQKAPWGDTCAAAAKSGHLEILKWARNNGAPWGFGSCENAASGGHLDLLKWARANRAPWDNRTCSVAARHGHLELLKWASSNEIVRDPDICESAAEGGHLDVLIWAVGNGYKMDHEVCSQAAKGGHLEVLKWAHANGAPWNDKTCENALTYGHFELLKWALNHGAPWTVMMGDKEKILPFLDKLLK